MPSADRLTVPDPGRSERNRLPSRNTPRTMSAVSSGMDAITYVTHGALLLSCGLGVFFEQECQRLGARLPDFERHQVVRAGATQIHRRDRLAGCSRLARKA